MWQAGSEYYNNEIENQYPEIWEKLQALRAQGFRSNAKEHQELLAKVPMGLMYFYDASNADNLPLEFNPDVFYSMAGDDADFLIGGDISKLDFRTQLKNLKMPILIFAGHFDRIITVRFAIQFKQYAPQATFVMLEKSGHFTFIEENNMFFDTLKIFLSK